MTTPRNQPETVVRVGPCVDSDVLAQTNKSALDLPRDAAAALARQTLDILAAGEYSSPSGRTVSLRRAVDQAIASKVSIPPDAGLPSPSSHSALERMTVSVCNETTMDAARRLGGGTGRPLALNFASPTHPGGGFRNGARVQEEVLARSSALYAALRGDAMYRFHESRHDPMATGWAILSPGVPVFRTDAGDLLEAPWVCTFLTCAAPQAKRVTDGDPATVMRERILRVLAISQGYGYDALVLGAWGAGPSATTPWPWRVTSATRSSARSTGRSRRSSSRSRTGPQIGVSWGRFGTPSRSRHLPGCLSRPENEHRFPR